MANHSPLPWTVKRTDGEYGVVSAVVDAAGNTVADNEPYYPSEVTAADLAFIARACSAHDELLAALKLMRGLLRGLTIGQIVAMGDEAIEAAGLNPWCINEGADPNTRFDPWRIDSAIATAEEK